MSTLLGQHRTDTYLRQLFREPNWYLRALDRGSLPTPLQYLTEHKLLKDKPRAEWAAITCPAHTAGADKAPTLNVSLIDGHFRCRTCGAKGGDVIALHRLITGMRFMDALRDLGGRFDG